MHKTTGGKKMANHTMKKPRGRAGWKDTETNLLWEEVRNAREMGLPLKSAFDNVAEKTGRKPNSIRNFYYAKVKEGGVDIPAINSAFTPFTDDEIDNLIETVLAAQAKGMSVRGITMQMGEGDKKAMLRYQNKYRSMVKNNPDAVRAVMQRMRADGKESFDPYSQQRPHKSGRKPNAQRRKDVDAALSELGASLKRIKGVDAGAFVQQLAALANMAVGEE